MKRANVVRGLCVGVLAVGTTQPSGLLRAGDAPDDAFAEAPVTAADREHWAFAPLQRPALPAVPDASAVRTPVDAFVFARLAQRGLAPAPEAERAALLRRLSFDLVGLPPTPGEVADFLADDSPAAFERQVERLLASPAYGEHWAQHWLDLARFAETDGFEHDKLRPAAWKFRDWVIAALNADLPFDRFVALQLAGDESGDPDGPTATMFCLSGPDMPDCNDQHLRRHNLLNELTATVGSVLLGVQLGCAQCHDHKFDPLSQGDFYRLRAVFEPAVPLLARDVPCARLANQADVEPARLWVRGDHRRPGPVVQPGFPRIASRESEPAEAEADGRSWRAQFVAWLFREDHPLVARVAANRIWQHHFGRGLADPSDFGTLSPGPTHPELLDYLASELRTGEWRWKHLHRLIVLSATYRQASRDVPLRSPAGRTVSAWHDRVQLDPANEFYSRFPRRRLDGEALRDAMLAVAGLLSSEAGGPGVMPPLPQELTNTLLKDQWKTSERPADRYRRSVYVFARRNLRYPLFEAFDRPDASSSCPQRNRSTTATASLTLLNGELSLLAARHLAGRILCAAQGAEDQIARLYELALARRPTNEEALAIGQFLADQQQRLATEGRPPGELAWPLPSPTGHDPYAAAALVDACLAVLNSNEFLYVD